jgi:hypothetical protein
MIPLIGAGHDIACSLLSDIAVVHASSREKRGRISQMFVLLQRLACISRGPGIRIAAERGPYPKTAYLGAVVGALARTVRADEALLGAAAAQPLAWPRASRRRILARPNRIRRTSCRGASTSAMRVVAERRGAGTARAPRHAFERRGATVLGKSPTRGATRVRVAHDPTWQPGYVPAHGDRVTGGDIAAAVFASLLVRARRSRLGHAVRTSENRARLVYANPSAFADFRHSAANIARTVIANETVLRTRGTHAGARAASGPGEEGVGAPPCECRSGPGAVRALASLVAVVASERSRRSSKRPVGVAGLALDWCVRRRAVSGWCRRARRLRNEPR